MQLKNTVSLTLLVAVAGLILFQLAPYAQPFALDTAAAQAPRKVYLPLAAGGPNSVPGEQPGGQPNTPPADDALLQLRARASEACPQLGPDQLCYVGGPVGADTKAGPLSFSTPGTIVDLAAVERLRLDAPGEDSAGWGLVRLRLRSSGELDLLAFGKVDLGITALADDATSLARLTFSGEPSPGSAGRKSSGLVASSLADELGALEVNGATLSLDGSVYLSADPQAGAAASRDRAHATAELERPLDVTVSKGVAQVTTAGGEGIAIQGQVIRIGKLADSPSPAVQALVEDYLFNLVYPLSAADVKILADVLMGRLETAIDRCVAGRVRYIYNVTFWSWAIYGVPMLENALGPARLNAARSRVPNCLSFELEFDSSATTQGGPISESSHMRASRLPISFDSNGKMRSGGEVALAYVSHSYNNPIPCSITKITLDGAMRAQDATLRVAANQLRFDLRLGLSRLPDSEVSANCPHSPPIMISESQWTIAFPHLHRDIWTPGPEHSFRFNSWRYTAGSASCDDADAANCPHVAEAIYQRQEAAGAVTYSADTHLVLVHTPLR